MNTKKRKKKNVYMCVYVYWFITKIGSFFSYTQTREENYNTIGMY